MDRAISPVVGVVLLTVCVAVLCGVVGTMMFAYEPLDPASRAVVGATVDAESNEITLTLERGGPLDVRTLTLVVEVDDERLSHQPPVPFVGASGFSTPSGPFNAAADPRWERGETAVLPIAGTNDPLPEPGSRVTAGCSRTSFRSRSSRRPPTDRGRRPADHSGTRATVVIATSGS